MTDTYPLGTRYIDAMDVADPDSYRPPYCVTVVEPQRTMNGNTRLVLGSAEWDGPGKTKTPNAFIASILLPAERDRLVDSLLTLAAEDPFWPHEPGDPETERLVWIDGAGIGCGTIHDLAAAIEGATLAGVNTASYVLVEHRGRFVRCPVETSSTDQDDDWATVVVRVELPGLGGHTGRRVAEASYRADLRV